VTRGSCWVSTLAYPNLLRTKRLCCCCCCWWQKRGLIRFPWGGEEEGGAQGEGGAEGRDREIRSGSGPELVIPCRRLEFGAIGHTSMGGGAFYYIGPAGLALQGKGNSLDLHLLTIATNP
jgi:hypothetical protein